MTEIIVALITGACTVIATWLTMKNKIAKEEREKARHQQLVYEKDSFENNIRIDEKVRMKLMEMLIKSSASCLRVYVRHNGIRLLNGKSFKKISMLYECPRDHNLARIKDFQELPSSIFVTVSSKLQTEGECIFQTIEDVYDPVLKDLFMGQNIQSYFAVPLVSLDGIIFGMMTIIFDKPNMITKAIRHEVLNTGRQLSGFLNDSTKSNEEEENE